MSNLFCRDAGRCGSIKNVEFSEMWDNVDHNEMNGRETSSGIMKIAIRIGENIIRQLVRTRSMRHFPFGSALTYMERCCLVMRKSGINY